MRLTDEQIGAELRALRPKPDETFASKLDLRAGAAFPVAKRKSGDRELRWRVLTPILAGLCAIAIVAVVVSNTGPGHETLSRGGGDEAGGGGTTEFAAPTGKGAAGGIEPAAPSAGTVSPNASARSLQDQGQASGVAGTAVPPAAPGTRPRNGRTQIQELSAALGLSVNGDQIQGAADGVVDVTNRYHGFVDSSDVHVGGPRAHAFFTLRIPATDLRPALDDFSDLGRVVSRDEGSANVTGAYVDAGKAFHEARAKVDSLLDDLREASTSSEAAAIRQELAAARQELAAARSALRGLKGRVAYAPVTVEIRADGDGSWSIGDAADDAVGVLEAIAGAALITLAVLVPLGALLALGWLGAQALSRRRREATLDRT